MKHLLNGVAIAAALAIAAPAWAQAPKAAAPAPAPAASAPAAPMAPMASKQRHKRGGKRMVARRGGPMSTTDQLNREELARIQGGGGMAPSATTGLAGQPNELRGIPGAGQPSASEHPAQPR
jgi:hypothetical protein